MNRGDNVFLLTLIDFLFQIIFCGVFLYALVAAPTPDREARETAIKRLLSHFGISDLVLLTDRLTRLVPADAATNSTMFDKLQSLKNFEGEFGPLSEVPPKLEKLAKLEEGIDKPPCIFSIGPDGRRIPTSIATLEGTETTITFKATGPEIREVLEALDVPYAKVQSLSLRQFREQFAPLRRIRPDCQYFVTFLETTRFVEPRDAVASAFRFSAIRRHR